MCLSTSPARLTPLSIENINSIWDDISLVKNTDNGSSYTMCSKSSLVVKHDYHDHASDNFQEAEKERPARGGVVTPFPIKLHRILDIIEQDGLGHVVSWQPHGRCFVIRKPAEFKELLPQYFKLSKMTSFQRQLNLYGFSRLTKGADKGGYYHELFLRGMPQLSNKMQRTKVKGTGVRAKSNPDAEPDLWSMTWVKAESHPVVSSQAPPTILPPTAVSSLPAVTPTLQQETVVNEVSEDDASDDEDVIHSFGGQKFHYLDPFELLAGEKPIPPKNLDTEAFFSELELEDLYERMNHVEDDDEFANILESIIQ